MWGGVGGARIFNLLTQEGEINHGSRPGKATLANVHHALKRLKHAVEKEGIESLALPAIATGVGGLSWNDVRPLLYDTLGELDIPIYIYSTFHAGVEANEE